MRSTSPRELPPDVTVKVATPPAPQRTDPTSTPDRASLPHYSLPDFLARAIDGVMADQRRVEHVRTTGDAVIVLLDELLAQAAARGATDA